MLVKRFRQRISYVLARLSESLQWGFGNFDVPKCRNALSIVSPRDGYAKPSFSHAVGANDDNRMSASNVRSVWKFYVHHLFCLTRVLKRVSAAVV